MSFEAREYVRYKMKYGILAALPVPGTLKVVIGEIIDISANGLALSHEDEITTSHKGAELVLMGQEQFDNPAFEVPARLVYEKDLGEAYRSGFQFGALSQSQTSRLASFIQSNVESIAVFHSTESTTNHHLADAVEKALPFVFLPLRDHVFCRANLHPQALAFIKRSLSKTSVLKRAGHLDST